MGSSPAVPAPMGRSAAPVAASTPSMATAFGPSPDSEIVAATTATSRTSRPANSQGASWAWAFSVEAGGARNGQPKPATPTALTRASAARERGPSRMARACRSTAPGFRSGPRSGRGARRGSGAVMTAPRGPGAP